MKVSPPTSLSLLSFTLFYFFLYSPHLFFFLSLQNKEIFPFFDIPSQGFFTGDLEEDTRFLQYFVDHRFEFFCSQFLSRIFGIYGMVWTEEGGPIRSWCRIHGTKEAFDVSHPLERVRAVVQREHFGGRIEEHKLERSEVVW